MKVVTFFGGIVDPMGVGNDLPVPDGASSRPDRLTMQHPYPCGHSGYDVYDWQGSVALFMYHEPAREHQGVYVPCAGK